MKAFPVPVVAFGPGSQPVEDEPLDFVRMPEMVAAFRVPSSPVESDPASLAEARSFLGELLSAAKKHPFGGDAVLARDTRALSPRALTLVNEALGEGEVAAMIDEPPVRLQETGFPGFWRVRRFDDEGTLLSDAIEVAPVPPIVAESALLGTRCRLMKHDAPPSVVNGPALLTELVAASARGPNEGHVVNLTLLPVSPDDVNWLVRALEVGPVTLLSRGYGNCRITSTRLRHTWWVQYFNSMDHLILNTIEVVTVPEVALAAPEDFSESLERLGEWLLALE